MADDSQKRNASQNLYNTGVLIKHPHVISPRCHILWWEGRKYFMEKHFETCPIFTLIGMAFREFGHFLEFSGGLKFCG